ncbi:hypothetical protein CYMTET_23810 [Cymbomonas tetramitiformis]|uniref:Carboxypeptidase n=1 Tax=Cymbomonas tetramitiformis TaxID=36881 RepID=A0AAE0L0J7_9CHLO|nr:hypothetical protein CYMTET_23810 [Cymbomonas tetramitiformis]
MASGLLLTASLLGLCVGGLVPLADTYPVEDEVTDLPPFGKPPSRQWSGWLDVSAVENGTFLHYWFAASSNDRLERTPIIMWLNGGPGAPASLGMMTEVGPLIINSTGGLMENPYAWTKVANVLIIEMPAGVGYSYCANSVKGGSCSNTDTSTAAAGRAALQYFFAVKFPFLRRNPFYIVGESYAGVYIPTLSKQILDHASKDFSFQGIAVGDPCTDMKSQSDSMDGIWYGHKYGFVPDADFDLLWHKCGARHPAFLTRGKWEARAAASQVTGAKVQAADIPEKLRLANPSPECTLAMRHFLASTSKAFSQDWDKAWIDDYFLYGASGDIPNIEIFQFGSWMISDAVKKALHVDNAPGGGQYGPQPGWSFKSEYAACNSEPLPAGTPSMVDFYREIAPKLQITRVYNGDSDPCVSYEGTRAAIKKVGFAQLAGGAYRPWFFNATAASSALLKEKPLDFGPNLGVVDAGAQFGGHVVSYEHNLEFVTFHGSGHQVPQYRPRAALHFITKLIYQESLSPFFDDDKQLESMTDDQYSSYLDKWTDQTNLDKIMIQHLRHKRLLNRRSLQQTVIP